MKRNIKFIIVLTALILVLALGVCLAACNKDGDDADKNAVYSVKLLKPYGEGAAAGYTVTFSATADENDKASAVTGQDGVASVKLKSEAGCKISISGDFSAYQNPCDFGEITLAKDEPLSVELYDRAGLYVPNLNYADFSRGTGAAKYNENGQDPESGVGQLDSQKFNPYQAVIGSYKLKFTSADQKIYIAFNSNTTEDGVYRIYSRGGVDATVQQLVGDPRTNGVRNPGPLAEIDRMLLFNDDANPAVKNFSLDFIHNEGVTEGHTVNGVCYFELALKDATHVDKEFAVCFEYVGQYTPLPPTIVTDIRANYEVIKAIRPAGALNMIPLSAGDFEVVYSEADKYYHLGSADGPVLYVNLTAPWPWGVTGEGDIPLTFMLRCSYGNVYEWSFDDGVTSENWLTFLFDHIGWYDLVSDGQGGSWYQLRSDAVNYCNADGYYPVTEQMKQFLTLLYKDLTVQALYFQENNYANIKWVLPEGDEWIFMCGYYGEQYTGRDYAGGSGSENDPYQLKKAGEFSVEVPAGGAIWYTSNVNFDVVTNTAGAVISYGGHDYAAGETVNVKGSAQKFSVKLQSGAAGQVTISVKRGTTGAGTEDSPYIPSAVEGVYSYASSGSDAVYFAFRAARKTTYDLTATTAAGKLAIKLYDADEPETAIIDWNNSEGQTLNFTLDANKEYFLLASDPTSSGATLAFEIAVSSVQSSQTVDEGGRDDTDHVAFVDDISTFYGAQKLEFITASAGETPSAQYWSFAAPANTTLTIRAGSGLVVALYYTNSSTHVQNKLQSDENGSFVYGSVASNTITAPLIAGQSYILSASASVAGVYDLNIASSVGGRVEEVGELGSSKELAIEITLEQLLGMTSVEIKVANQPVYYKIAVDSDVTLTLTSSTDGAVIVFESTGLSRPTGEQQEGTDGQMHDVYTDEDYYSNSSDATDANDLIAFTLHAGEDGEAYYIITFNLSEADSVRFSVTQAQ